MSLCSRIHQTCTSLVQNSSKFLRFMTFMTKLRTKQMIICGSSGQWLIMVNHKSQNIALFSPSTTTTIELPPLDKTISYVVHKAALSTSNVLAADYLVMVIYWDLKQLAYYKGGDETWTRIEVAGSDYDDIIYYKDDFYAIDDYGKLVLCELKPYRAIVCEVTPGWFFWGSKLYLVEVKDCLCLVIRDYLEEESNSEARQIRRFRVYRLGPSYIREWACWRRCADLNDCIIALGNNQSVAIEPVDIKGELRPNCLYFKDDFVNPKNRLGSILNKFWVNRSNWSGFNVKENCIDRSRWCSFEVLDKISQQQLPFQ